MPATVPEIIPAPAPAAAPIQELRPARVPRQVEDVTPSKAPCRAPRRVANNPVPATSVQVPVLPEVVRADCSHSFSREDSTNCASPVGRAGALVQPAPSSIAPRAPASRLRRHTASMRATSRLEAATITDFRRLRKGVSSCPVPGPRLSLPSVTGPGRHACYRLRRWKGRYGAIPRLAREATLVHPLPREACEALPLARHLRPARDQARRGDEQSVPPVRRVVRVFLEGGMRDLLVVRVVLELAGGQGHRAHVRVPVGP